MNFKNLIIIFLFVFSLQVNASENKLFCATYYAFYHEKEVRKLPTDKAMHCTMSCYLAVSCPQEEALLLGYLKELWDLIGPGDADINDIKANKLGIKFSKRKSKPYCKSRCLKKYPKK